MDFVDGSRDIAVTSKTIPGFLIVSLVNLRTFPIESIHVDLFPTQETDFRALTRAGVHSLAPLEAKTIIFAYSLATSAVCDVAVLFKVPDEVGIVRNFGQVLLPAVIPSTYHSGRIWETLLLHLNCSELDVGNDWAPVDVIQALNNHFGSTCISLGNFTWGSIDPIMVMKCDPASKTWRVYTPDLTVAREISASLPHWVTQEGHVRHGYFHLGMIITFLRDYIDAQVDTEWADSSVAKAGQLLRELRIPASVEPIAQMLKGHHSLGELSDAEKLKYNRILADIEKEVSLT